MTEPKNKPGRPKDLVTRKYVQVRLSAQEEAELKRRGGSKWLQQILNVSPAPPPDKPAHPPSKPASQQPLP